MQTITIIEIKINIANISKPGRIRELFFVRSFVTLYSLQRLNGHMTVQ